MTAEAEQRLTCGHPAAHGAPVNAAKPSRRTRRHTRVKGKTDGNRVVKMEVHHGR